MACPNFKNGPKKSLGPLGVNIECISLKNLCQPMIICMKHPFTP
jgi:hypothetical protein